MRKQDKPGVFQYVLMLAIGLFRWGAQRLWEMLTFWQAERKKPAPDRQKIDRVKAVMALLAIAVAVGAVAFFVWKGLIAVFSMSMSFIDRQTALYIGAALLILGLQMVRYMKRRRLIGLVIAAAGGLMVAYGLGYIG